MAQRITHKRNAGTTIQRVAGMTVPEPVRADIAGNACALSGCSDYAVYLACVKWSTLLA